MNKKSINYGQLIFKYICLVSLTISTSISFAQNQEKEKSDTNKYFDGFHIGLSVGSQNIFGGAFIDELDVLGQKNSFVVELSSGYRRQLLDSRLLIGVELQFGITNSDLEQVDDRNQLMINYENNSQFGYGVNIGVALGERKNVLVYTYGSITKRNFDILIINTNRISFSQKDGQRFLRYGIGLETPIYKKLNIKATVGRVYVDFEDLKTNMNVDDKLDFNLGIVYQF